MCHVSHVTCHVLRVACHLSLTPTGKATDPPPANSPTIIGCFAKTKTPEKFQNAKGHRNGKNQKNV